MSNKVTVTSPPDNTTIAECAPVTFSWTGGKAPYIVFVTQASKDSPAIKVDTVNENSYTMRFPRFNSSQLWVQVSGSDGATNFPQLNLAMSPTGGDSSCLLKDEGFNPSDLSGIVNNNPDVVVYPPANNPSLALQFPGFQSDKGNNVIDQCGILKAYYVDTNLPSDTIPVIEIKPEGTGILPVFEWLPRPPGKLTTRIPYPSGAIFSVTATIGSISVNSGPVTVGSGGNTTCFLSNYSSSDVASDLASQSSSSTQTMFLSSGAIVGIVVGSVILIVGLVWIAIAYRRRVLRRGILPKPSVANGPTNMYKKKDGFATQVYPSPGPTIIVLKGDAESFGESETLHENY